MWTFFFTIFWHFKTRLKYIANIRCIFSASSPLFSHTHWCFFSSIFLNPPPPPSPRSPPLHINVPRARLRLQSRQTAGSRYGEPEFSSPIFFVYGSIGLCVVVVASTVFAGGGCPNLHLALSFCIVLEVGFHGEASCRRGVLLLNPWPRIPFSPFPWESVINLWMETGPLAGSEVSPHCYL